MSGPCNNNNDAPYPYHHGDGGGPYGDDDDDATYQQYQHVYNQGSGGDGVSVSIDSGVYYYDPNYQTYHGNYNNQQQIPFVYGPTQVQPQWPFCAACKKSVAGYENYCPWCGAVLATQALPVTAVDSSFLRRAGQVEQWQQQQQQHQHQHYHQQQHQLPKQKASSNKPAAKRKGTHTDVSTAAKYNQCIKTCSGNVVNVVIENQFDDEDITYVYRRFSKNSLHFSRYDTKNNKTTFWKMRQGQHAGSMVEVPCTESRELYPVVKGFFLRFLNGELEGNLSETVELFVAQHMDPWNKREDFQQLLTKRYYIHGVTDFIKDEFWYKKEIDALRTAYKKKKENEEKQKQQVTHVTFQDCNLNHTSVNDCDVSFNAGE